MSHVSALNRLLQKRGERFPEIRFSEEHIFTAEIAYDNVCIYRTSDKSKKECKEKACEALYRYIVAKCDDQENGPPDHREPMLPSGEHIPQHIPVHMSPCSDRPASSGDGEVSQQDVVEQRVLWSDFQ
ncbi:ORF198 [Saltwater crocodilepox virus]|nr:hypothetical protein [Saltwater crocodilepox virus]QGT46635.1 ORF198 [Saltwater crocodilepox virus]QGT46853.1 ORF198 [Saltwater crocodilepox virus]QGT47067.1 ORF198 [Saltwater crocodilepox virus]QGT47281.1 ORF198 [Saltwater crocodilepox virus]